MALDTLAFRNVDAATSFGGWATKLTEIRGPAGLTAIAYQAILNEDFDGAAEAYAPLGKRSLDGLGNGTNNQNAVFSKDKPKNFTWAGVYSLPIASENTLPEGYTLDRDARMEDAAGHFPVLKPTGFYVAQCKPGRGLPGWDQNNYPDASAINYTALTPPLIRQGIDYGDVGVSIRNDTGTAAAFVIADRGLQNKVGECSTKHFRFHFARPNQENHPVSFIVFSKMGSNPWVTQGEIDAAVRTKMSYLSLAANINELVLLFALGADWNRVKNLATTGTVPSGASLSAMNIRKAFQNWGLSFPSAGPLTTGRSPGPQPIPS